MIEELNFLFSLTLMNFKLHLNGHMLLVTTIMDSTGLDTGDLAMNRTAKSSCSLEAYILVRGEWV